MIGVNYNKLKYNPSTVIKQKQEDDKNPQVQVGIHRQKPNS